MSADSPALTTMRARQRRAYGDYVRPESARCVMLCWVRGRGDQIAPRLRCLLPREHFGPCFFDERRSGAERRAADTGAGSGVTGVAPSGVGGTASPNTPSPTGEEQLGQLLGQLRSSQPDEQDWGARVAKLEADVAGLTAIVELQTEVLVRHVAMSTEAPIDA